MQDLRRDDLEPGKTLFFNRESVDIEPPEPHSRESGGDDRSMDPETITLQDVIDVEMGHADLSDETSDGLDDLEEEVRRQAEDRPFDTPGRE